ncbi:hypothetical protein ACVIQY_001534 [Bradyrhizobium sp. USDA 3051]
MVGNAISPIQICRAEAVWMAGLVVHGDDAGPTGFHDDFDSVGVAIEQVDPLSANGQPGTSDDPRPPFSAIANSWRAASSSSRHDGLASPCPIASLCRGASEGGCRRRAWLQHRHGICRGHAPESEDQIRASRIRLKGVSAARRKRVSPPSRATLRSLASPACAPSARPTSWSSEAGVQIMVDAA